MSRNIICVDIETDGLHADANILEVAAVDIDTGEELYFVPHVESFNFAQPEALQINRYFERGAWRDMLSPSQTVEQYQKLARMLEGNTFAGSNPRFDADKLKRFTREVWHYRLFDVSAYAAGALGLRKLPGLHQVCELLGVVNEEEHSALGDARATAECIRRLRNSKTEPVKIPAVFETWDEVPDGLIVVDEGPLAMFYLKSDGSVLVNSTGNSIGCGWVKNSHDPAECSPFAEVII